MLESALLLLFVGLYLSVNVKTNQILMRDTQTNVAPVTDFDFLCRSFHHQQESLHFNGDVIRT